MGCRDCPRCTESFAKKLVAFPFRLVAWGLTFWNVRMFQKWCPQCRHLIGIHERVGGRFMD